MNIILRWARSLYRKAILKHLIAPEIVVLMDGGICSQMHQYLLGRFFAQKGYKVSYDLSFYRTWGTDLTHRFVRNFDLLKAFPYIEITKASDFKISVYKERFYVSGKLENSRIVYSIFFQMSRIGSEKICSRYPELLMID